MALLTRDIPRDRHGRGIASPAGRTRPSMVRKTEM